MKRKISTISNNSFDSIYSEKKLRLLKIIVPPLLKFPDIFSSSLGRRSGRGNWMERLEGKFENDSYEFEVKIFREGCTIRVFRSKEQKNPSNAFHYPFFLIIHLIPCLLSSFHIPVHRSVIWIVRNSSWKEKLRFYLKELDLVKWNIIEF